jgi:hypothetical protein
VYCSLGRKEKDFAGIALFSNNLSSQVAAGCSVTTDVNETETLGRVDYCGMTAISAILYEDGILWLVIVILNGGAEKRR